MFDRSPGFFDLDGRFAELSARGDGVERVRALIEFEMFCPALEGAVPRTDGLGRVDKFDPDADAGKQHERGEALDQLVIAGGDAA